MNWLPIATSPPAPPDGYDLLVWDGYNWLVAQHQRGDPPNEFRSRDQRVTKEVIVATCYCLVSIPVGFNLDEDPR